MNRAAPPLSLFGLTLVCYCSLAGPVFSQEEPMRPIPVGRMNITHFDLGSNCGIYCAMAALNTLGLKTTYEMMNTAQHVSSHRGSSMADLIQALSDNGAYTMALKGLTPSALIALETPCILHVRRDGTTETHSHWVLFLGIVEGKARLFNPPNGEEILPLEELLYLWDGKGIAIFAQKPSLIDTWRGKILPLFDSMQILAVAGLGMGLFLWPFWPGASSLFGFGIRLGLATLFCVLGQTAFSRTSLGDRWDLYATIARAKEKHSFDLITTVQLQQQLRENQPALVDARLARDFGYGHLPGAFNLPIDCGPGMVRVLAQQLGNRETVVYCQSAGCGWSEVIAKSLALRGVGPIHIFKGGYAEWQSLKLAVERP